MNWTKTSAIAETLSSVAILITLVYLVVEIQQNAEATQAETRQAMLDSDQQYLQLFIDSPEIGLLFLKPDLSDEERIRLSNVLLTLVRMRESNWLQYENGALDSVTWQAYLGSLIGPLSGAQSRAWWENFGVERIFNSEFISLVDELLAAQPLFEQNPHLTAFD